MSLQKRTNVNSIISLITKHPFGTKGRLSFVSPKAVANLRKNDATVEDLNKLMGHLEQPLFPPGSSVVKAYDRLDKEGRIQIVKNKAIGTSVNDMETKQRKGAILMYGIDDDPLTKSDLDRLVDLGATQKQLLKLYAIELKNLN
jgi:hypothetical protein